jgi:hypothetical protein
VALNQAISASGTGTSNASRITYNVYGTREYNYANNAMTLTTASTTIPTSSDANDPNGQDISSDQWGIQNWWSGTADFAIGTDSTDQTNPWRWNDGSRERPLKLWFEP